VPLQEKYPETEMLMLYASMQMGVAEGWIYVLSEKAPGTSFRVFDPRANKWSVLPPILGHSPQENWQGFACVAVGHKLILMGGRYVDTTATLHSSGCKFSSDLEAFYIHSQIG
jgi:hypothetical protein